MLKKKTRRILPLLMAVILATAGVPMVAGATDTAQNTTKGSSETTAGGAEQPTEESVQPTENADSNQQEGTTAEGATEGATEEKATEGTETEDPKETTEPKEETEQPEEEAVDNKTDTDKVVTLGENLTEEQRAAMYKYFGTSPDKVKTIVVTHMDEVERMEGIATAEQIGPTTNSCAYVEPTESGGIKVKTANLNFVTSAMIASTLATAGMENCNVIAACPFEVSGTGALTGIIMAYETASGETLDEGKKEAAMEELITTGNLANELGQEKAAEIINDVKTEIVDKELTDTAEIGEAVDNIAGDNDVTLTDEQKAQVVSLMEKISGLDYDVDVIKNTLENLSGQVSGLSGVWNSIKSFFVGSGNGIISETDDSALGEDIITDSTVDDSGYSEGLITRIKNFFTGK